MKRLDQRTSLDPDLLPLNPERPARTNARRIFTSFVTCCSRPPPLLEGEEISRDARDRLISRLVDRMRFPHDRSPFSRADEIGSLLRVPVEK